MDQDPTHQKAQANGNSRYKNAIEMDDIQLEQCDQQDPRNLKTPNGDGKANRIGQYRKTASDNNIDKSPTGKSPLYDRKSPRYAGKQDLMEMDDASYGSSPFLRTGNTDADMKQAVFNMHETQEVNAVIKEFEKCFCGAKTRINECDLVNLECEITVQALKMQYKILQGLIFEENSNFDQNQMEQQIQNMVAQIKNANQGYNKFKGEFFAVNEPVINKDILVFKLDRVQRYLEVQKVMMEGLPNQETGLQQNFENLQSTKKRYQGFEKQIFENKFQDTSNVIKDTSNCIEKIELQQVLIQDYINKAKTDLAFLIPQNKEQRLRLMQINGDIQSIQKRLEISLKVISRSKIEQEQLEIKNNDNSVSLKNMKPIDMVQDITQTRELEKFVQNHNDWLNLYKKLKQLKDQEIMTADFDLQKSLQDTKKYIDGVINGRKEEYDDLLKQIQKVAKKVNDDINEQDGRLQAFEAKMIIPNDGSISVISDSDLLFLKKEVSRIKYTLQCAKASNDKILADSLEINNEKLKDGTIEIRNLQQMSQNLRALQKIESVDIERISRNIDLLEGFTIKNLKNTLNDDNKKCQVQISKMKKNYEDLQKYIDALNAKLVKVSGDVVRLKENFANDDLERINELFVKCDDKLEDCDMNINGDKSLPDQDPTKVNTMQARKKDIIALINKMVNVFNENNKMIKESNKQQKTEKEISYLIKNNNEIQEDCRKIEEKVSSAKEFASEIDLVLESILDPAIQEIKDKYSYKNQKIDDCDELFDQANAQIDKLANVIAQHQAKIKEIISKLDSVNPIMNPSTNDMADSGFKAAIQLKIDVAYKLQDDLEAMKENLGATRDSLIDVVQPLNELDEREVKQPEIDEILKALEQINESLGGQDRDILPKGEEIQELENDLMNLIDENKGNKINEAIDKLKALIDSVTDLSKNKDDALEKLNQFKKALQDAKKASKNDPELAQKIKELEDGAKQVEKEINDIDMNINNLKRKSADQQRLLEEIKMRPDKFKPAEIEDLLLTLDELIDKSEQINDRLKNKLMPNQDEMLRNLNNLVGQSQEKQDLLHKIDDMDKEFLENLLKYKEQIDKLPGGVDLMINTLQECLADSTPDKTADYFKEKEQITKGVKDLKVIKANLEIVDITFQQKKADVDSALQFNRGSSDIPELTRICEILKTNNLELEALLNETYDNQDEFNRIKKEHGDYTIPLNIRLRQNELKTFSERLDYIYEEFAELKQADNDFTSEASVEERIRQQIQTIDKCVQNAERDRKEQAKFYKTLGTYTVKDFQNCSGNHLIIKSIREFRFKIIEQNKNLIEIERMISDLNSELIRQDMDNAIKLLAKKSLKLRQRLQEAKEDLTQIKNCGEEMDGNTTVNEEDEFIDALKDEMPEVFKNIEFNFEQLDGIESLIVEIKKTKNLEMMQTLKKEVDDASNKVEQSEGLVLKLENEIIEWNALRKLCTRDEELFEIDTLLQEFDMDLKEEYDVMHKEIKLNKAKHEKDGDPKGELEAMKNGIISYSTEIEELMQQVQILSQERTLCYTEFDMDVPSAVKQERLHRLQQIAQQEGKKFKNDINLESDKPADIYYMITINCRYKQRIHSLLKELRNFNQRRRELDDKYALLKKDLSAMKLVKTYKPVKGDAIDELFAVHMNKVSLNLPVKRLGEGSYLFGTKKILAKIINGKLVIRVGGGYMSADEFIEQYGRIEMLKMMKAQGQIEGVENHSRGSIHRSKSSDRQDKLQNVVAMGDMKKQLRDSIMSNTNVYGQLDTRADHKPHQNRNTMRMENNSRERSDGNKQMKKKMSLQSPLPTRFSKMVDSNSLSTLQGPTQLKKVTTPLLNSSIKKGL